LAKLISVQKQLHITQVLVARSRCSFCAVVPIYNARWKGKSAGNIYKDILYLKGNYGGNAIEFHDNNFFVSVKRVVEFSELIKKENMVWWGEGRIDTINKYSDESLRLNP
jgi:radical SAM superfamily enzyme YgiQ (UPF0313 family)